MLKIEALFIDINTLAEAGACAGIRTCARVMIDTSPRRGLYPIRAYHGSGWRAPAADVGLEALGNYAKESILDVGDSVVVRIETRLRGAVGDVVEAVTERALTEVAETMVNAQMGVMITSTIGPYVPVVVALQPALPAVQDALDVMRGGF